MRHGGTVFELVNLNLQEEAVREYLLEVIRFWITEFDIDGIRLDCADCLDFYFMEEMRRRTSEWKEDFWLMGEVDSRRLLALHRRR